MKKIITLLLLVLSVTGYSQKIIVTPSGLRDSTDLEKSYVVISCPGKDSKQLYNDVIKYINRNYKSPVDVIKGNIEGEFISFKTHVDNLVSIKSMGSILSYGADYTTTLNFKDGKIKWEAINIEIGDQYLKIPFTASKESLYYGIYDKNGKLKMTTELPKIEDYFNNQIEQLKQYIINPKLSTQDNW